MSCQMPSYTLPDVRIHPMPPIDFPPPEIFADAAISEETRAINDAIAKKLAEAPDPWSFTPAEMRERRRKGLWVFPVAPLSPRAQTIEIDGPHGAIPLRIIAPTEPRGVYLHIHGGGWVYGGADEQDPRLERIADRCGLAVVSVDYRLAPEHPYPQGPDDCEAAALWLTREATARFGTDRLMIGGESAGAHLSVVTLTRLRDRHGLRPFVAANLIAGCYDLRLTPSAANWGPERLVLGTVDLRTYVGHFAGGHALTDPDVSPVFADLSGLPRALFTVGTRDPLLDDTLFMASRWAVAGNEAELGVYPGGAHVFIAFAGALAEDCLVRIDAFLRDA